MRTASGAHSQQHIEPVGLGIRVLVAEDNRVNQEVVRRALESANCWVDIAEDGAQALEMFKERGYDLILMDCHMPELDGYQATGAIRNLEADTGDHTPIVALTANAARGDRERCMASGMDDYLAKPVRPGEIRGIVRRWCGAEVREMTPTPRTVSELDSPFLPGPRFNVQIAQAFLGQAPGDLAQIKEALAARDAHTLARTAHRLKSSCAVVGSPDAESLCRALETQGRANDLEGAASLVASLDREMQALETRLGQHLLAAA